MRLDPSRRSIHHGCTCRCCLALQPPCWLYHLAHPDVDLDRKIASCAQCRGCGLWKPKLEAQCKFCIRRPNRAQAQVAWEKHEAPRHMQYYSEDSRQRAAAIKGSPCVSPLVRPSHLLGSSSLARTLLHSLHLANTSRLVLASAWNCYPPRYLVKPSPHRQRPCAAPAHQTTSCDFELRRSGSTPNLLSRARGERAKGPGGYKSSALYRSPSGLRKIVAQASSDRWQRKPINAPYG